MTMRIGVGGLAVARVLFDFVNNEALPGTGISQEAFWQGASTLFAELTMKNQALLDKRERLQQQIDDWHKARRGQPHDGASYKAFLQEIGYWQQEPDDFVIKTQGVDEEIAQMAGPQLVVPASNARFALNAANARWGSLYDALYGTDVISELSGAEKGASYNPVRGAKVVAFARKVLDEVAPLAQGSHLDAQGYAISGGQLSVQLKSGQSTGIKNPSQFLGFQGPIQQPTAILLIHNGLHVEIQFDAKSEVGKQDPAGIKDILLEAALSTIIDCEDSVAAVDAEDKVTVYRNWLGLMKGDLTEVVEKNGVRFTRTLNPDREYQQVAGSALSVRGRSLLFVRNVGHLMRTPAIVDQSGRELPEGILDALITSLCAVHDLQGKGKYRNSRSMSVYIVKPKMHGAEEVAFTVELFERVETLLGLPKNTLKLGLMDEERRTSLNLKACIKAASERLVFINTGFLDRTGDEIHSSMQAGAMLRKAQMKGTDWLAAYEAQNVDIGLACGLSGRAQIGKGMWAMPDLMAAMLKEKIVHPKSAANTAWVPSPTAATLHALHYHQVDVFAEQKVRAGQSRAERDRLLAIPLADKTCSAEEIATELDNNAQSILGYVVRWVEQGIGCSKVPDIDDVALMEDRATLRISSQLLANWLLHGLLSEAQIRESFARMAQVVDRQNAADKAYRPMCADLQQSLAFQAALALVLQGAAQPSGYTEPLLHHFRRRFKEQQA
ncbi:malate synthase G [Ventosimonas gracilis]|uniref:Malate synthase G n=1 Tax=Ventosimonas gracilis TaxID=1680762 RepID=A0A139SV97_9GAMM|nr:malate synthase G [Ventosimonas gracilis]KXU38444.1 malate synthase G [Ventosimonas gracilis]